LKLRDMGGIIVVDFIDMYKMEHKKILFKKMRDMMKEDKAKHNVLPPSKIGLIQITRERVRPQVNIEVNEVCPSCKGTGKIGPSVVMVDEIYTRLVNLCKDPAVKKPLKLEVHPYVEAFITKKTGGGLFSTQNLLKDWQKKIGSKFTVEGRDSFQFLEYKFIDVTGEEIL